MLIRGEFENEEERLDMMRSLIEAGANINIQTVNVSRIAVYTWSLYIDSMFVFLQWKNGKC